MLKKLFFIVLMVFGTSTAMAQEVFWGFDENDRELIVPPECDNTLDSEELFSAGMRLLEETGYAKQGAPYCLLAAALDNHAEAQYQVARLYQKGILLPKSDLAAYKWATLGALNGHADADRLGATLEQFLSIQDIEAATRSLDGLLPTLTEAAQQKLDEEDIKQEKLKEGIALALRDAKDLKKYGKILPHNDDEEEAVTEKAEKKAQKEEKRPSLTKKKNQKTILSQAREKRTERAKANGSIFSKADLENAPMPSAY